MVIQSAVVKKLYARTRKISLKNIFGELQGKFEFAMPNQTFYSNFEATPPLIVLKFQILDDLLKKFLI